MLILFDQGAPIGIRTILQPHTVRTAAEQGWSTLLNGELLRAAEDAGFDVLLTTDTNIPFQQNLDGRRLAIVIVKKIQPGIPMVRLRTSQGTGGSLFAVCFPK